MKSRLLPYSKLDVGCSMLNVRCSVPSCALLQNGRAVSPKPPRTVRRTVPTIKTFVFLCGLCGSLYASEPKEASTTWTGVDETVIEKHAEAAGRSAREPLINTDQGDLLLFVFLLAGALGGFVAGYAYRGLTISSKKPSPH
jgi:cobalt/nickel transport protein